MDYFGYETAENARADFYAFQRDELRELQQILKARYGRRKCFHVSDVEWAIHQMRPMDNIPKFVLDDVDIARGPVVRSFAIQWPAMKKQCL